MNPKQLLAPDQSLVVAVTGSAGSGKSVVCRRMADLGAYLIDADQLAREVVKSGTKCLQKIVSHFGPWVLAEDGLLDRSALRRQIIVDIAARKALEAIIHPEIITLMEDRIHMARIENRCGVVVELPLLFELGLRSLFDIAILVRADRDQKIKRLMERDHASKIEAAQLLDAQMPDDEKQKHSDFTIENNGSRDALLKKVDRLYEIIYFGKIRGKTP